MAKNKQGTETSSADAAAGNEKADNKVETEGLVPSVTESAGDNNNSKMDTSEPNQSQQTQTTNQSKEGKGNKKQKTEDRNGAKEEEKGNAEEQEAQPEGQDGEEPHPRPKHKKPIKLYKSTRLKGYLTLVLSSVINYDAAEKSNNVIAASGALPSTTSERNYAISVALVSLILTGIVTVMHLDTLTPLEKVWVAAFKPKSRIELVIVGFLVIWWSVATGIQTSVRGIAGDGKGQYSLYFSSWACTFASYWVLERWWVAAGLASLKSFITSWPYRSPGWLCIFFMGSFTLIWYLDLWRSHDGLDRPSEFQLLLHFEDVPDLQWTLVITLIVFTVVPAAAFILAEICRQTKPDGSNEEKSKSENMAEGLCLLALNLAWIPAIIWVTAPGGAASLVGNAYFSSWLLVIFIAETGVWFVHDLRERIHLSLEHKQREYREKQRRVVEKAHAIQKQKAEAVQQQRFPKAPPASAPQDNYNFELEPRNDAEDEDEDDDLMSSDDGYMDALTDF